MSLGSLCFTRSSLESLIRGTRVDILQLSKLINIKPESSHHGPTIGRHSSRWLSRDRDQAWIVVDRLDSRLRCQRLVCFWDLHSTTSCSPQLPVRQTSGHILQTDDNCPVLRFFLSLSSSRIRSVTEIRQQPRVWMMSRSSWSTRGYTGKQVADGHAYLSLQISTTASHARQSDTLSVLMISMSSS